MSVTALSPTDQQCVLVSLRMERADVRHGHGDLAAFRANLAAAERSGVTLPNDLARHLTPDPLATAKAAWEHADRRGTPNRFALLKAYLALKADQ